MLTVQQVADRLNVSPQIVYAIIAGGKLAVHRIGLGRGTIRVDESDLKYYLESCRNVNKSQPAPRVKRRAKLRHIRLD